MDKVLLAVYLFAGVLSLCLFLLVLLVGGLILILSSRDLEKRYEFLKNMIYGGFGGIIATILVEIRGSSVFDPYFYAFRMPISILTIFVFILLGFLYIFLLEKLYNWVKLNKEKPLNFSMGRFWKKIWDKEDNALFGELFLIVGGFLVLKWFEIITPEFPGKDWLYLVIGFLLVLFGIKLSRKS